MKNCMKDKNAMGFHSIFFKERLLFADKIVKKQYTELKFDDYRGRIQHRARG